MNRWAFTLASLFCLLMAQAGRAGSILYYSDYTVGTDRMSQALGAVSGTYTVTNASSISDFTTKVLSGNYQLAIFFEQGNSGAAYDSAFAALATQIANGGLAIADDWTRDNTHAAAFQATFTGGYNQTVLTVTDASLSTGLSSNPETLSNPGWGVFSTSQGSSGGTVAASFADSSAGIIAGNGGRTFFNGFLSDTFANGADGEQLYINEINAAFGSQTPAGGPTPEPATLTLLGIGLAGLGAFHWRRRKVVARPVVA